MHFLFFALFPSLVLSIPVDSTNGGCSSIEVRSNSNARRELEARATFKWTALGDSFSSGPGAGEAVDKDTDDGCLRNTGSYPAQLNKDFPFGANTMNFLSCSGDVVSDIVDTRVADMDPNTQFITLSIGGNDLGFATVIKACLVKPAGPFSADCDETLATAETFVSDKLGARVKKAYDAVFKKLSASNKAKVVVELYPSFFAIGDGTEWCDKKSFGIIPGSRPKLTTALRNKLNKLANNARSVIIGAIDQYNKDKSSSWGGQKRLYYLDEDNSFYNGHRFCEKGLTKLGDSKTWFFTLAGSDTTAKTATSSKTASSVSSSGSDDITSPDQILEQYDPISCVNDSRYNSSLQFSVYCDVARYLSSPDNGTSFAATNGTLAARDSLNIQGLQSITKFFHPKTAAHTYIKDRHKKLMNIIL